MTEYTNIPGVTVHKEDGNLLSIQSVPGDVTLIIGTSPDGPLNQVYLVQDAQEASLLFDSADTKEGDLVKRMYEAFAAGTQYIALYRIGASPAVLDFLNGFTIHTKSTDDGSEYKVEYGFTSGQHTLKITSAATDETLYSILKSATSETVLVDTGAVVVYFKEVLTTDTLVLAPTALNAVDLNLFATPVTNATLFSASGTTMTVVANAAYKAGGVVEVAGSTSDNGDYLLSYADTVTLKISHKLVTGLWVPFTGFVGAADADTTIMPKTRFIAPNLGLTMTDAQKYEALANAYWELEAAKIDMLIPGTVFADSVLEKAYQFKNDGQIFFQWTTNGTTASTMPTPYSVGLDGVHAKKLLTGTYTIESILTDVASPAADITFGQPNFAHQLAEFLHSLSVNDNEAIGVISVKGPVGYSKHQIETWIGTEPSYDADGAITASGTGLLGWYPMTGNVSVAAGFFDTIDGFIDGTAVVDANKRKIDIGKYLSIVASPLALTTPFNATRYIDIASSAATYAGQIMSLDVKNAPTGKVLSSKSGTIALPLGLTKENVNKLVGAGYIVFKAEENVGIKCVDAPTAALKTSDYKRLLTVRSVNATIELVRSITSPFIGNVFSGVVRSALEERVNRELLNLASLGYLLGGSAAIRATRDMEIKGEATMRLILQIPGELRKLTIYVSLAK